MGAHLLVDHARLHIKRVMTKSDLTTVFGTDQYKPSESIGGDGGFYCPAGLLDSSLTPRERWYR